MRGGLPLKKGHPSYKATNSLQKVWPYERGTTSKERPLIHYRRCGFMRGGLPLKKDHPSYKATNSLQVWPYERGTTSKERPFLL
jgi:hypothetical protein